MALYVDRQFAYYGMIKWNLDKPALCDSDVPQPFHSGGLELLLLCQEFLHGYLTKNCSYVLGRIGTVKSCRSIYDAMEDV